ncbi:hypothetical protein EV363DRAFT_1104863, partial [Boletus edulis]
RTNLLIVVCKNNLDFQLKLFSDSTQDATEQGRTHRQMSTNKDSYYQLIAKHVFTNCDLAVQQTYHANPLAFIKTVKSHFAKYYNGFNKELSRLGAGVTVE